MRVKLTLKSLNSCLLDYNYNYYIQGMIYEKIAKNNADLAFALHHKKGPKFFVFSSLFFERLHALKEGIKITKGDKAKWFFSSPKDEVVFSFIQGLIQTNNIIKIGPSLWTVEDVDVLKPLPVDVFDTLSPIYVSIKENGRIIDLSPHDPRFYEQLSKNLEKKYRLFYGEEYPTKIKVFNNHNSLVKSKRIRIKNTFHIAYQMKGLRIVGSRDLLNLAYDAGIGEKNSMGFGMLVGCKNGSN